MKYSVDEIIDEIIKLEDLETRDVVYLDKKDLDFDIRENDILVFKNNKYYKRKDVYENRYIWWII